MKDQTSILISIADDCALTRFSLRTLISAIPGYKILAEASNGNILLDSLHSAPFLPEIIILDIGMPLLNGYETIKALKKNWPQIKVIVLSQNCGPYSVRYMLQNGANAFLSKEDAFRKIGNALYAVTEHGYYYSDIAPKELFEKIKRGYKVPEPSSQQKKILHLIFEGRSNKEIATVLDISVRSVESYKAEICKKFDVKLNSELLRFAVHNEMVHSSSI